MFSNDLAAFFDGENTFKMKEADVLLRSEWDFLFRTQPKILGTF